MEQLKIFDTLHKEQEYPAIVKPNVSGSDTSIIEAALLLAYEAGRWHGQVDLEKHMDREQYSQVMPEVFASRKTSLPNDLASTGRTVRYNLRSDKWRQGVVKSSMQYYEQAKMMLANHCR